MNNSDLALLEKAQLLRARYPDRIPVVFIPEKHMNLTKQKFLVPRDLPFSHLITTVRKYIDCKSHEAIYCMVKKVLPPNTESIGSIYNTHCMQDGIMYVHIKKESTFG